MTTNTENNNDHSLRPKHKILVVDDERPIADMLAVILNRNNYNAEAAYGGMEAVERSREFCPDLVLTDVVMPDMNGVEAAMQIRRICPDCHILLFSGMATTADLLADARQRGESFEMIAKPVHPRYILERLSETLS